MRLLTLLIILFRQGNRSSGFRKTFLGEGFGFELVKGPLWGYFPSWRGEEMEKESLKEIALTQRMENHCRKHWMEVNSQLIPQGRRETK